MKLFNWFKLRKARKLFPKIIEEYWAASCAGWNNENTDEIFPYWIKREDGTNKYNDLNVGNIVPVFVRKGYVAFYIILDWSKNAWYDGFGIVVIDGRALNTRTKNF